MRRQITVAVASISTLLLLVGTVTPIFKPLVSHLPPHSDVLFHFVAHVLLVVSLIHIFPVTPPEIIASASVLLAVSLEIIQYFLKNRSAEAADLIAATVASAAAFVNFKDGPTFVKPRPARLYAWLFADDDDDDIDSHRVASWAV